MRFQLSPRALYAAFDRFPSPKGAATHIGEMAGGLFEMAGGGGLYVLGGGDLPYYQQEGSVEILRFDKEVPNFLDRALSFGSEISALIDHHAESLEICHFRDPWSGVPIILHPRRDYRTVYEVNGLPSIELPYSYPGLSSATLAKIRAAEELCWNGADEIITPSQTIADNLIRLGAPKEKITVVYNGAAVVDNPPPIPPEAPDRYILYFGALQRWQGIDVLLHAFSRLADIEDLHLVVCSSTRPRTSKIYRKLAERLEIADRVLWQQGLSKSELGGWLAGALLTVAPLAECSRNLEQGCSPLKVFESMAAGIPVVATDLPATREIIVDGVDGRLVRGDRPAELARAIRVMLEYPERLREMGENAREKIRSRFTWEHSIASLRRVYEKILFSSPPPADTST